MAKPKEHSLEQLLKEHAEIIDELDDNSDWVNAPAVGRELISSADTFSLRLT